MARELYERVGVDVTRFFFQMRKPDAHLLFDLDVALDQSDKNPVYKVQYAHARMCSIFAKAGLDPASVRAGSAEEALRRSRRHDNGLLGRWAEPREIAYPILFLACAESSFVTGATLMVDAGRSII